MKFLYSAAAGVVSYCLAAVLFPAHISLDFSETDWASAWTYAALLAAWMAVWLAFALSLVGFMLAVWAVEARRAARRHAAFLRRGLK